MATTAGDRLVLRPAAQVPRELVTDIARHRDEIVALLNGAVILGPWLPTTEGDVAEEWRRVLEEEPSRWWWQPRYRLAELERGGMDRAKAIAKVRDEVAAINTVTVSCDHRREAEGPSERNSE